MAVGMAVGVCDAVGEGVGVWVLVGVGEAVGVRDGVAVGTLILTLTRSSALLPRRSRTARRMVIGPLTGAVTPQSHTTRTPFCTGEYVREPIVSQLEGLSPRPYFTTYDSKSGMLALPSIRVDPVSRAPSVGAVISASAAKVCREHSWAGGKGSSRSSAQSRNSSG